MVKLVQTFALALLLSGCVTAPDGRRVLSPEARRAMLEQVLSCSLPGAMQTALSAVGNGGIPDEQAYLDLSRCHLDLIGKQLDRSMESAPAPSVEHGKLVLEARQLEDAGNHTGAKRVARECDEVARFCWLGEP